jgi:hypothetical protein
VSTEIEEWRLLAALRSFEEAIKILGEQYQRGESLPNYGYFARKVNTCESQNFPTVISGEPSTTV